MKRFAYPALLAVILSGCATDSPQQTPIVDASDTNKAIAATQMAATSINKPAAATKPTQQKVELAFINSRTFDSDLSDAMRANTPEIVVTAASPFTLNNIPERLDKWLGLVKEKGGTVTAQALPPKDQQLAARGLLGVIIDVVVALVQASAEHALTDPAKNYDARLYYDGVTGGVERVNFMRRTETETSKPAK